MSTEHGFSVDADGARVDPMVPDAIDERQLSSVAQALLKTVSEPVSDPAQRVYAVMDGSQFNDLPRLLQQADVSHRPLYRYAGGDYAVIVGGPWLVDPYHAALSFSDATFHHDDADGDLSDEELHSRSAALSVEMVSSLEAGDPTGSGMLPMQDVDPAPVLERLKKIIELSDGKPALVFWSGCSDLNVEALYRHLRGLNRISVPTMWRGNQVVGEEACVRNEEEFAAAGDHLPAEDLTSSGRETVIFRHSDANVMMQTIPALDEVQVARLFGPATQLVFAPDKAWGGGVKRAQRQANISAPPGPLKFDRAAMQMMSASRLEASRQRVLAYLREVDPGVEETPDPQLMKTVIKYEQSGSKLGIESERAHMKWAYLMSITNGLVNNSAVKQYFDNHAGHPDDAVDDILDELDQAAGGDWDTLMAGEG